MLSKRSDEDVTRRSRVRRNSFNAFQLFCISPYTAAASGMFSVRFQLFGGAAGFLPQVPASPPPPNPGTARSRKWAFEPKSGGYGLSWPCRARTPVPGCCWRRQGEDEVGRSWSRRCWHVSDRRPAGDAAGGQLSPGPVRLRGEPVGEV